EKEFQSKPTDPTIGGEYAWGLLQADNAGQARRIARQAIKRNPKDPWAALVLAHIEADDQQYSAAIARLEPLLDRLKPRRAVLLELVKLKLLDDKPAEALALCDLALAHFPRQPELIQGVAAASSQ